MLKTRLIRSAAVLCAAGAVMIFMSDDAQAQRCGYRGGYGGGGGGLRISVGYGNIGYGAIGGYRGYRGSYGQRYRRPVWHDTSHYDYYPSRYVRHRDHYDYVPGHYRFHRSGHWDH